MTDLMGKVAIVTGGSRGIGRGIAERLGRDGAYVVVNYADSEQAVYRGCLAAYRQNTSSKPPPVHPSIVSVRPKILPMLWHFW